MRNPYDVLGIRADASDDEIKKAYRKLSRMYHPDANVNNPNKAQAEEKFKEVQQAYDAIMNKKTGASGFGGYYGFGGSGFSGYGTGGAYGSGSSYTGQEASYYVAAANYIRNGRYTEAIRVLNEIKLRDGRWYYLSAVAMAGSGNTATAMEYAKTSVELEPDNMEYRQFYSRLVNMSEWYVNRGAFYGMPSIGVGNMCCEMCIANLVCNICCC